MALLSCFLSDPSQKVMPFLLIGQKAGRRVSTKSAVFKAVVAPSLHYLPPNLQPLFKKAAAKWSKAECEAINQFLNRFQDVFSKDEFDIGKTHLVEHLIETRNAAPVKLPPGHIPLAFADEDWKELEKLKKNKRSYPAINIFLGSTPGHGPEMMWSIQDVPGVPEVKHSDEGCCSPNTLYPGLFGMNWL